MLYMSISTGDGDLGSLVEDGAKYLDRSYNTYYNIYICTKDVWMTIRSASFVWRARRP